LGGAKNMKLRWHKETRKKKPPVEGKPLRRAGQSLDDEINSIVDEKVNYHVTVILYFVSFTVVEWYRWYSETPIMPGYLSVLTVPIIVYSLIKIFRYRRAIKMLAGARDGERHIGELLETLRAKGYVVFHDLIGGNFNVDHVLVGPTGVFTIETKTISKPVKGQAKVDYDGEKIRINGFSPERDPIIQAKAQAKWLQELITDFTGKNLNVRPAVLYPGWYISPQPKDAEVWVLNPKALSAFLDHERPKLSSEEVHVISAQLSRYSQNTASN